MSYTPHLIRLGSQSARMVLDLVITASLFTFASALAVGAAKDAAPQMLPSESSTQSTHAVDKKITNKNSDTQSSTADRLWLRLNHFAEHLKIDPKGLHLAYTVKNPDNRFALYTVDLKTRNIHQVTDKPVDLSFFWSPDGFRLFYRELYKKGTQEVSVLKAYDASLKKNVTIDTMPFATGFLTYDPRDFRLHILSGKGLHSKRIEFPDGRLARWQTAQKTDFGKWVASPNGILWMTTGGRTMRRMQDDDKPVQSFDVSPDGTSIVWATEGGKIFYSRNGEESKLLDYGKDPSWHPDKLEIVYSGARMVGKNIAGYDVKIADLNGFKKFVTTTQFLNERFPSWHPTAGTLIYAGESTTDVFHLKQF